LVREYVQHVLKSNILESYK